jgi:PIN domain nuclease of toxin-antitoxin system
VTSAWEIPIKVRIGKLPIPKPIDTYVFSRMRLLDAKYLDIIFLHAYRVAILLLWSREQSAARNPFS